MASHESPWILGSERLRNLSDVALGLGREDIMGFTKAEQETVVRWDREDRRVELYTSGPAQARHWTRLGSDVRLVGTDPEAGPVVPGEVPI
jgi:hypothetical protein